MNVIFKSWKTTAAGIVLLGLTVAFLMGRITMQQLMGAFGVLAGGGLVAAKDGDVSGGAQ